MATSHNPRPRGRPRGDGGASCALLLARLLPTCAEALLGFLTSAADRLDRVSAMAQAPKLSREDIVLAITAGADGPYDLDPIRLMKGCFLVSQRGLLGGVRGSALLLARPRAV